MSRDIPELERLPGAAGIKVFMGSSTGSLLVADDAGVAAILGQTRRRAAFHSEDESRLQRAQGSAGRGDPSSHPVWRDEIVALRSTRAPRCGSRAKPRARSMCCMSRPREEMEFLAGAQGYRERRGDAASSDSDAPRTMRGSARILQMNPPVRDAAPSRRASGGGSSRASPTCSAPTTRRTRCEEKAQPYPESPSGMTGVQTLVPIMLDHVNAGG